MKKILTFVMFILLSVSFYTNTYAKSYPLETGKLQYCNVYKPLNKNIFPCANNIYTYSILYGIYSIKDGDGKIMLSDAYNYTDLFGYDNPILAGNLVTAIGFLENGANVYSTSFLKKYAGFNYNFIKKLLVKLRAMPKQQRIQFLTKLYNKLDKIYKIVSDRLDKYEYKKGFEKQAKKYDLYEQIVGGLKYSTKALLYYDTHNMVDKYLKHKKWRQRMKNWGPSMSAQENNEMEDREAEIEERKKNMKIPFYFSIKQNEDKFNCHGYELPKNVYNLTNPKDKKLIGLAICIMEKGGLPKDIGEKYLNQFKYYFNIKDSDILKYGYTIGTIRYINGTYAKVVVKGLVYFTKSYNELNTYNKISAIIHELSHNINFFVLNKEKLNNLNAFIKSAWSFKGYKKFQHNKKFINHYYNTDIHKHRNKGEKIINASCIMSDYGRTDKLEDFAEYGVYFFYDKYLYPNKNHQTFQPFKPYSACMRQREIYFRNILNDIK